MATTLLEMAKRTPDQLMQGLALSIVTQDNLAALIPFETFQGKAMVYNREGALPDAAFVPDDGTMGSPSDGTTDQVIAQTRLIAGDTAINSLANTLSNGRERAAQLSMRAKSTWRLVKRTCVTGRNTTGHTLGSSADPFAAIDSMTYGPYNDSERLGPGSLKYDDSTTSWSYRAPGDTTYGEPVVAGSNGTYTLRSHNPSRYVTVDLTVANATSDGETHIWFTSNNHEFDGLERLVSPNMVVPSTNADGDDISFDVLDHLLDLETVNMNRAFFAHSSVIRRLLILMRSLGGTNPEHMRLPGYNGEVLAYRGVPILSNDWIPTTESKGSSGATLSSVWLASLDADQGLCLGVPGTGTEAIDVFGSPRRSPVLGFEVVNIGERETVAHQLLRVKWHGLLALKSSLALARASEIITT